MIGVESAPVGGLIRYTEGGSGAGVLIVNRPSYGIAGRGARVTFTIVDSCFGRILIGATRVGICWMGVCDSDAHLKAELHRDLAAADIVRGDGGVAALARMVIDFVCGRTREVTIPIDLPGTPFQISVWRELCAIPWGATRSYGEIARRLARPDASRAVGAANGSNPLAIIIPCHRAIGADGSLTGYRWGLEYKRRLLDYECALAQSSLFP